MGVSPAKFASRGNGAEIAIFFVWRIENASAVWEQLTSSVSVDGPGPAGETVIEREICGAGGMHHHGLGLGFYHGCGRGGAGQSLDREI
jgi:hypothetical protein